MYIKNNIPVQYKLRAIKKKWKNAKLWPVVENDIPHE